MSLYPHNAYTPNGVIPSLEQEKVIGKLQSVGVLELFTYQHLRFTPPNSNPEKLRELINATKVWILNHPEDFSVFSTDEQFFGFQTETILSNCFSFARQNDIDLTTIPFWQEKILNLSDGLETRLDTVLSSWSADDYIINLAALNPNHDWDSTYRKSLDIRKNYSWVNSSFKSICEIYSKRDIDGFKQTTDSAFFANIEEYSYSVRGAVYSAYVAAGLLDKKKARKMRSESSSEASLAAARALLDNKDKYTNFDELILQFTDSQHSDVVRALADGLPINLLSSIVGTKFEWIKNIISKRMTEDE